jgi:hypothetical protein
MSELNGYYEAFSYRPSSSEPADHVSVKASFLGYLRLKEAYAISRSELDHAAISAEAARCFLEDHVSVTAARLAGTLESCGLRYLSLAGRALARRVGARRTAGLGLPPVLNEPRADDESLFDCESPLC